MTKLGRILFLGVFLSPLLAFAEDSPPASAPSSGAIISEITNLDEIAKDLKLSLFKGQKFKRKIKIAIFDKGFNGWEAEAGKRLPVDIGDHYHNGPPSDADKTKDITPHGLELAVAFNQLIAKSGVDADYELHLFNASGLTKFTQDVADVIAGNFDVVLYAQAWEFGGNGDGKGFINAEVDKAVAAGIIWINSSGNYGHLTRLVPVEGKVKDGEEWLVFKNKAGKATDEATFYCKTKAPTPCPVKLYLSWNDFQDDQTTGTAKDLDLFLYDDKGKQVASAESRQKLSANANDTTSSIIPFEFIEGDLAPGKYTVRVKIFSKNFSAGHDQARLMLNGPALELADANTEETLLPPADNPGVIVIGASDDIQTSKSQRLGLPEIFLKSVIKLKDGTLTFESTNSATFAAVVAVLNLGTGVDKTKDAITEKLKALSQKPEDLPAQVTHPTSPLPARSEPSTTRPVGSRPPAHGRIVGPRRAHREGDGFPPLPSVRRDGRRFPAGSCVRPAPLPVKYEEIIRVLAQGQAMPVEYEGQVAIVTNYDFEALVGMHPHGPELRVFITPGGAALFDQFQIEQGLPPGYYEVISVNLPVCDD